MRAPGMWIAYGLIFIVISFVLAAIPLFGQLAVPVLLPVLFGGWLLAVRKLEEGGVLTVADLFGGFDRFLVPLLIVGAINLGATVVVTVIAGVVGMGAVFGGVASGAADSGVGIAAAAGVGLLALLVMFLLFIVIGMAMWFAPALVVFAQVAPVDAIRASFAASLKNIPALGVFAILNLVASLLATLALGLGWLVLIPVVALTMWTSYRDIFASA